MKEQEGDLLSQLNKLLLASYFLSPLTTFFFSYSYRSLPPCGDMSLHGSKEEGAAAASTRLSGRTSRKKEPSFYIYFFSLLTILETWGKKIFCSSGGNKEQEGVPPSSSPPSCVPLSVCRKIQQSELSQTDYLSGIREEGEKKGSKRGGINHISPEKPLRMRYDY